MTFRDIQELLVSSVRPLLLLRDLIKFITEAKESQTYIDQERESNAVAIFNKHEKFSEWCSKSLVVRFLHFSLVLPSLMAFFNVFQVNSKVKKKKKELLSISINCILNSHMSTMKTFVGLAPPFSYCLETSEILLSFSRHFSDELSALTW